MPAFRAIGLIVNADDCALTPAITDGVLACIRKGRVTATGIMPNMPDFARAAALLRHEDVDVGVHLALTAGAPLTRALRAHLPDGRLPGKFRLMSAFLRRRLPLALVRAEWRAQIERCLQAGLALRFANSHEHLHMWPPLFALVCELAREYRIPHIRLSAPDGIDLGSPSGLLRDLALTALARRVRARVGEGIRTLPLVGLAASGRLDGAVLERLLASLPGGSVAELLCHPGYEDGGRLHRDRERRVLCDPGFPELLARYRVRLVRYRDLGEEVGRRDGRERGDGARTPAAERGGPGVL